MPIFDFLCLDCGKTTEFLATTSSDKPECSACGGFNLKKLLSAPSSLSGTAGLNMPGPGDTACCGTSPAQAACAGPGSCCGKTPL